MNDLALRFEVAQANGEYRVFFSAKGSEAVEARFLFDASPGTQVAEKLADIEANVCSLDDIYFVGEQMWLGLTSGPIKEAVASLRSQQPADTNFVIRLELPEALHSLPWEALYAGAWVRSPAHRTIVSCTNPPPARERLIFRRVTPTRCACWSSCRKAAD